MILAETCPTGTINNVVLIMDLVYQKLLWIYPFAWAVVIVRKIFYA